jgi:hypothetical protein
MGKRMLIQMFNFGNSWFSQAQLLQLSHKPHLGIVFYLTSYIFFKNQ